MPGNMSFSAIIESSNGISIYSLTNKMFVFERTTSFANVMNVDNINLAINQLKCYFWNKRSKLLFKRG